jgi:hypothetical protein
MLSKEVRWLLPEFEENNADAREMHVERKPREQKVIYQLYPGYL